MARRRPRSRQGFSVARTTYRGARGGTLETSRYYARFKDHAGIWHRVPAFSDYDASLEQARKLRHLAELRATHHPPDEDLAQWVDELPDDLRDRLHDWGILDRRQSMASWPIADHIEDWHRSILADGRTKRHADLVRTRTERVIQGCNVVKFADLDKLAVKDWLAQQDKKIETRNHYVRAIKQFAQWMIDHGRASVSPVAGLKLQKVTDKTERRALTIAQLQRLIETAHHGPTYRSITGPERAILYWLAAESGLRACELRSLTAASFDLDAKPPTVTVQAAYAKNRRRDTLALTAELVSRLRDHLKGKLPGAQAFSIPEKTADMIRFDLHRTDIPDTTTDGRLDFHALRVTCASNLASGGAHPAVAQARMRHSTIKLTMDLYTRLGKDEQAAALEALPKLKTG